jgi:hypothetical protein
MNGRRKAARVLVAFGSVVLLAGAALHSMLAYPSVSAALAASNLSHSLQSAMRAVFLLVGWDWIVIAMIVLFAGFTETMLWCGPSGPDGNYVAFPGLVYGQ